VEDAFEGSFSIDALDAATGELIWHGSAWLEIQPDEVNDEHLRRAVNDVLDGAAAAVRQRPLGAGLAQDAAECEPRPTAGAGVRLARTQTIDSQDAGFAR
jgi:hypothetical protein